MTRAGKNRLLGSLMAIGGISLMFGGGFLTWQSVTEYDSVSGAKLTRVKAATREQCLKGLEDAIGSKPVVAGDSITVSKFGLDEPEMALSRASVGLLRCPGMKLTSFCYGEGCPKSGLTIRLAVDPDISPEK